MAKWRPSSRLLGVLRRGAAPSPHCLGAAPSPLRRLAGEAASPLSALLFSASDPPEDGHLHPRPPSPSLLILSLASDSHSHPVLASCAQDAGTPEEASRPPRPPLRHQLLGLPPPPLSSAPTLTVAAPGSTCQAGSTWQAGSPLSWTAPTGTPEAPPRPRLPCFPPPPLFSAPTLTVPLAVPGRQHRVAHGGAGAPTPLLTQPCTHASPPSQFPTFLLSPPPTSFSSAVRALEDSTLILSPPPHSLSLPAHALDDSRALAVHVSPLPMSPVHTCRLQKSPHVPPAPCAFRPFRISLSLHMRSFHAATTTWRESKQAPQGTGSVEGAEGGQKLLEGSKEGGRESDPGFKRQGHLRSGPVTWGSLALLVFTGAGLLWYFEQEKQRRLESVKRVRGVGKAAIGGPIRLIDQDGKPVTESNLKGQWNLLYFGFTYCPDICPAELEKMAAAVDILEKKQGVRVQPVFISVDPQRDNPSQVKAYIKEFHPRMLGLTGTVEAVREAAREFRVYYMKTEEEGEDYLVDHSIIMYLMDPKWEFVKFFGKNHSPESLAEGISSEIRSWSST